MNKPLTQNSISNLQYELIEVLNRHNFACMNVTVFSCGQAAVLKLIRNDVPVMDKDRCEQTDKLLTQIIIGLQGGREDAKGIVT